MNNGNIIIIIISLISFALPCFAAEEINDNRSNEKLAREYVENVKYSKQDNVLKQKDAVPDKTTAIKLALIVWKPIYGKEQINKQAPFEAIRIDDCWFVSGSLPRGWRGGTAMAVIRAKDGRFLNVSHGK
jgi:hypothetical protein